MRDPGLVLIGVEPPCSRMTLRDRDAPSGFSTLESRPD
jgi:hypothetical protein